MAFKEYLAKQAEKRNCELDDLKKRVEALEKINDESQDEEELKAAGEELDQLKAKKAELEAELEEINNQIAELDKQADDEQGQRSLLNMIKNREERKTMEIKETKEYRNAWLKALQGKTLTDEEKRSVASGDVAVIPTDTLNLIITKTKEIAPLVNEITLFHVDGNLKIGVETTVNDASLHSENAAITASADVVGSVSLGAYEIVKLVRISATVKTMAIAAFETWLTEQIARKIAEKIEHYIVKGTGSSEPKGVDAETYTNNTNGVQLASSSAITYAEIIKLISLLPQRHSNGAKFYCNRKMLWGQIAAVKDDSKYPVFKIENNTIMGYPVVLSDEFDDGDLFLGNLKNGYYGNLSQDVKVEASAQSGFTYNAIDYRGVALYDGKVADTSAIVKAANTL